MRDELKKAATTQPREVNARIIETRLGVEASVFTYWVRVVYTESNKHTEGGFSEIGQAFGGIRLDGVISEELVGKDSPANILLKVIEAAEATCWEDLVGRFVRIRYTAEKITEVGHISEEDKWVKISDLV